MSISANFASPITTLSVAGLFPLHLHFQPFRSRESDGPVFRVKRAFICAASLNGTCAAQQTQTVTRQSSTITITPIQWKEKSPKLDDGGTRFPPRDDVGGVGGRGGGGDGGGHRGGGGDGWHWSGGFLLFMFLAFLSFLKDQESEEPYLEGRRKSGVYRL